MGTHREGGPATGKTVPTRPYGKQKMLISEIPSKPSLLPITKMQRSFYVVSYLFDEIGKTTGIADDLKACFPDTYRRILSVAYYLILEENNLLSRFSIGRNCISTPAVTTFLPKEAVPIPLN